MISERSLSILQELINIGVGQGARVLNTLLSHHVTLSVPEVLEVSPATLSSALGVDRDQPLACVQMGFRGSLDGEVQLLFPAPTAAEMVTLILGEGQTPEELDFVRQATLTETGNIVINAVVGTLSNLFGFDLRYTLPVYQGGTLEQVESQSEAVEVVLLARTSLRIEDLALTGSLLLFFSLPTYRALEEALESYVRR